MLILLNMQKSRLLGVCIAIMVLSVSLCYSPSAIYSQSQPPKAGSNATSSDVVSVSASVAVQVANQTLKDKDAMLRSAVSSFLNSGPNILKSKDGNQDVMTKIVNKVNNATQNVQGSEATNAIIIVEISKALKSLIAQSTKPNQAAIVTIDTSSSCKPSDNKLISCQNTVTIK